MGLNYLKKLANIIEQRNNSVFSYPVIKQQLFMNSLKYPYDDIERGYNQYLCQRELKGNIASFIINILSLPILIYYYFKRNDILHEKKQANAVFFSEGISPEVIPNSLKEEFKVWEILSSHGEYLAKTDKLYFKVLVKRHPLSWHFLLKCLIKIRFYSYEIKEKKPQAIVVCGEYSFTSSVLTDYCNRHNILHIDVMHGEKLIYMRDSFFRYDRCYVWNQYYIDLFVDQLHAEKSQFKIEIPNSMCFKDRVRQYKIIDYTYYLGGEHESILYEIARLLENLMNDGYTISVRPHPRYSDLNKIAKIFKRINIEDAQNITIEQSLMKTRYAVALYSTVLNQALYNGIPIVIDDMSNPNAYRKLDKLGYICMNKRHQLLSEIFRGK